MQGHNSRLQLPKSSTIRHMKTPLTCSLASEHTHFDDCVVCLEVPPPKLAGVSAFASHCLQITLHFPCCLGWATASEVQPGTEGMVTLPRNSPHQVAGKRAFRQLGTIFTRPPALDRGLLLELSLPRRAPSKSVFAWKKAWEGSGPVRSQDRKDPGARAPRNFQNFRKGPLRTLDRELNVKDCAQHSQEKRSETVDQPEGSCRKT